MQTTIHWTGQQYNSVEHCSIRPAGYGHDINATIDGRLDNNPFHVTYFIKINKHWETMAFNINSDVGGKSFNYYFEGNGQGVWMSYGNPANEFDGCIDIDISVTPFTNSLPINRLKLANKEKRKTTVLYIDVLKQQTRRMDQFYTKLADNAYKFETANGKFKSELTVDEAGLVTDYPDLFIRTAAV